MLPLEEQHALILQFQGVPQYVWREHFNLRRNNRRFADCIQEGMLALVLAARSYRPEKGSFKTWAVTIVRREMSRFIREDYVVVPKGTEPHLKHLSDNIRRAKFHSVDAIDVRVRFDRQKIDVHALLGELKPADRWVVEQRYLLEQPGKRLALEAGITPQAISWKLGRAIKRLRHSAVGPK